MKKITWLMVKEWLKSEWRFVEYIFHFGIWKDREIE